MIGISQAQVSRLEKNALKTMRAYLSGAGDSYAVIVPQIPANLSDDHGHRVSGKLNIQTGIEIVDGLDQADTGWNISLSARP